MSPVKKIKIWPCDQIDGHDSVGITESEVTVVTSLGGGVVISGGRASTLMKKSL